MAPKRKSDELELLDLKPDLKPDTKQEIKQEAKADARDGKRYHYVEQELMPNSVALDPNFIKLSDKVDGICRRFQEVLKNPRSENRSIKMFADGVSSDILKRKVDSTTMSLTGPMGSGKSETINTILHETIAPTGKSGSSVTLVPHKYCGHTATQKKRFLAKIVFFGKSQRTEFFETELAAYYRSKNAPDSENGADDEVEHDVEDVDVCDTVVDALYFLFMAREECRSRNAVRDFLKSATSEHDQRLVNRLCTWADAAIRTHADTPEGRYATIDADTAETLLAKLAAYTSEATEDDGVPMPSLWPLVSGVEIYFDNPLSKMGVSLLDVPGSSDNHIRRIIAQDAARKASHTAIIAPASRANSGNSISKEAKVARSKGDGRMMVIITCSDEIDEETVVGGTPMQRQQVKQLRVETAGLEKHLNATKLEQRSVLDMQNEFRLFSQLRQQESQLKEVRGRETALRIAMRGENTRETIQRKLSEVTNFVNPIPVFWLSNLPYRKHRAGYFPHDAPFLTVEETNGPAIRRTISEFPNTAIMRQLEHIYISQLPMLFSRVRLFSTRAPAELKADIEGFIDSPQGRYPTLLEAIMSKMKSALEKCILFPLRDEESNWIPKAEKLCDRFRRVRQTF